MSERCFGRERAVWIALVSVLATSMLWLATLAVLTFIHIHGPALAPAFALARAIARMLLALLPLSWPFLPMPLLAGMMLTFAVRSRTLPNRGTRNV
jgi:hypothetical protein